MVFLWCLSQIYRQSKTNWQAPTIARLLLVVTIVTYPQSHFRGLNKSVQSCSVPLKEKTHTNSVGRKYAIHFPVIIHLVVTMFQMRDMVTIHPATVLWWWQVVCPLSLGLSAAPEVFGSGWGSMFPAMKDLQRGFSALRNGKEIVSL